jgi:hypothetical protein
MCVCTRGGGGGLISCGVPGRFWCRKLQQRRPVAQRAGMFPEVC